MYDLALINGLVYTNGDFFKLNVYIESGRISALTGDLLKSREVYDLKGRWLLPGFIDPHVHFELTVAGRTSVDDFYRGSIAAAFGGVTTFVDFTDPARSAEDLRKKFHERLERARKSVVDYAFHATLADPRDRIEDVVETALELGMPSIKVFTTYSSTDRRTYDGAIDRMLSISRDKGIVLLVHSENDEIIKEYENTRIPISLHSDSRPTVAELSETVKLAQISAFRRGQLYVVHVSSGITLREIGNRFGDVLGRNIVLETCPHYLYFDSSVYRSDLGKLYAMTPPLRSSEEVELLKGNFHFVGTVGTDHCPFNRREKLEGDYTDEIPMGIGGVEFSFVLMYTLFGDEIIDRFTINVAKYLGLYPRKGVIAVGSDADLVVFDPDREWEISGHHGASDYNVYDGIKVRGKVVSTLSRGRFVVREGDFVGKRGWGEYLKRESIKW